MAKRFVLVFVFVLFAASLVIAQAILEPKNHLANVQVQHVFLLMEENHGLSDVLGNAQMPYINSLIQKYSVAYGYFGDTHPSIGNYFMLTTGQIITNNDGYNGTVSVDNVVRELIANGKTWKEYSKEHSHLLFAHTGWRLRSVRGAPQSLFLFLRCPRQSDADEQSGSLTQLATDIANHALPNYAIIVPNLNDDAHNGTGASRHLGGSQYSSVAQ